MIEIPFVTKFEAVPVFQATAETYRQNLVLNYLMSLVIKLGKEVTLNPSEVIHDGGSVTFAVNKDFSVTIKAEPNRKTGAAQ